VRRDGLAALSVMALSYTVRLLLGPRFGSVIYARRAPTTARTTEAVQRLQRIYDKPS
jgi:hypothetical protein